MEKSKGIIFRTLKTSGVHAIAVVQGGLQYFMEGINTPFTTENYHIHINGGATVIIPEDETVITIDRFTKRGVMRKTVDILREVCLDPSNGLVEVTEADLKKEALMSAEPQKLADAVAGLLKAEKELKVMTKEEIYGYIESLTALGFDISELLKSKEDNSLTKDVLVEKILKATK